jgi:AraC-like DNA-binding protein
MREFFLSFGCQQLLELHDHKNQGLEIVYLERGALKWHVEHRDVYLPPNSVFFTLPWQLHGSLDEYNPGHRIHWLTFKLDQLYDKPCSNIAFLPEFGFSPEETVFLSTALVSAINPVFGASEILSQLMQKAILELENPSLLSESYLKGLMRCILLELGRIIHNEAVPRSDTVDSSNKVNKFLEELSCRCTEDWTLEDMAQACQLKRTQFALIVKKLTGESPLRYLIRLRINKAREMLRDSSLQITKIALLCGFSNSQYFAKTFKEMTQRKPLEYRKVGPIQTKPSENFLSEEDEEQRRLALIKDSRRQLPSFGVRKE